MRSTFFSLSLLVAFATAAQDPFPTLLGETANGVAVEIPANSAGKFTLVGLAYGQKAQPILEEWYEPAYLRFVAKHGLFAGAYNVNVYFVPLFVGLNKAAYEPAMKKFRKSAEPEVVEHVVFSKADIETVQVELGLKEKDVPYFFVLDAQGRIVHRVQGAFTDDKLDAIEEVFLR